MNHDYEIGTHNDAVTGYIHTDETRAEIFGAAGLTDDSGAARDAVNLNNADDWPIFHQQEIVG